VLSVPFVAIRLLPTIGHRLNTGHLDPGQDHAGMTITDAVVNNITTPGGDIIFIILGNYIEI
jgi:hypothetical protein